MLRLLAITTLLAITGCQAIQTTRALGSLQAEYGDLLRAEEDCKRESQGSEACFVHFPSLYGFVESQAADAIAARTAQQTLTEQQVTIALYRLAAFAALKSGSNEVMTYAGPGSALCSAVEYAPPRDCALLGVVGQFEVANAYARDVTCLAEGRTQCERSFEALATDFCGAVLEPLRTRTDTALQTPHLPDSVVAYLKLQSKLAIESQATLAGTLTQGLGIGDKPRTPCECATPESVPEGFDLQCGNVTREPMATFRAECVRRALAVDPSADCPGF
ncbi:MAG: hypothetical protein V2I66_13050 [Halieaceae bacterium]|jgi:hypothetical protein|nr:hypothetical protein [Halieaceae bacterium]